MARNLNDPDHEQLRKVLLSMLERDEDITARGVSRIHPTFKSASDITRHEVRRALLADAALKQRELRALAQRMNKKGKAQAAKSVFDAEQRIKELEANETALICSHLAMIRVVAELGGTAKLMNYYSSFAAIRDSLVKKGALPQNFFLGSNQPQ